MQQQKITMENTPISSLQLQAKFKGIRTDHYRHATYRSSQNLRSSPLPINSFFQSFLFDINDYPPYIHPYFIKPSDSSLSLCYPSRFAQYPHLLAQLCNPPDVTIKFNSLTTSQSYPTWLIYASLPIKFSYTNDISEAIVSDAGDGDGVNVIVRIAVLPDLSSELEDLLDRYSTSHPLHLQLLSKHESNVAVLQDFKYRSIDGDLVGVLGDSWLLKADHVPIIWHSIRGAKEESFDEIKSALSKDVNGLCSSEITISVYDYAKSIARAARLALIAEEVGFLEVIPAVKKFLHEAIQPLLDGAFDSPSFLYDAELGGIINKTRFLKAFEEDRLETFYITIISSDTSSMELLCLQRLIHHGGRSISLMPILLWQISLITRTVISIDGIGIW
ncbi:hypothetical protein PIB30_071974 [Stylosanthes scabra]|uniref:glucan endo-1,3-beta-D-glucosidase n=1 Tax=Stylosanthes scabra TaxID=79078 RepID=A0ABU6RP31_9FABA|nr:hypothetical protein [Stylosanthes scabra]